MRWVVLVSGGGTTLQNLLDRQQQGRLTGTVVGVVSSRADAFAVVRAEKAGIPAIVVPRKPAASFTDRVYAAIEPFQPDYVLLAGWLHLLPIRPDYKMRVLNIHPSLLPAFGGPGMYGHHVHTAAIRAGVKFSGCTVHFADDEYDTGPIVDQAVVPVLPTDTPEVLAARVFEAECELYPRALAAVAAGFRREGQRILPG
ncbi:MAG: phosphoribosylglycinamide formyltransferase [Gemmataceae bacterium]